MTHDPGFTFPRRPRGRLSAIGEEMYQRDLATWCKAILQINSTLDFRVSSRGWCYILEEKAGLAKGDFNAAQRLINACRKDGNLPLDICSEDEGRAAEGVEDIDGDVNSYADGVFAERAHLAYDPVSFWENQPKYVQLMTEKVDLRSLFSGECKRYRVPIQNASGWNDINSRAAIMRRFEAWEAKGKQCVLLYCGDHDPAGLHITEFIRSNLNDLSRAVGWTAEHLIIERFGLDADFIRDQRLTWIDGLETGSGADLADPNHADHFKPYVQDYLRRFGARKVEANALVTRPEAGRALCRAAIERHVNKRKASAWRRQVDEMREELHVAVQARLAEASGG